MLRARLCAAAAVVGALSLATVAHADSTTATASDAVPAGSPLQEIVVVARRREEDVQKVPVAVTAYSQAQLVQKHITDRDSLSDNTPSMIVITGGYPKEFAVFSLRGQGPAFGSVPGVLSYFDDVTNPLGVDGRVGTYFDLSSVQVLAGPQGTLFGKNATGGNILFEPQKPTDRFEGYVQGEYGNYNDRRIEGAVNLPLLDDRVLLRVGGDIGRRDGTTTDVGPYFPGKKYDNLDYDSGRISLTVKPTDTFELDTVARYYHSTTDGNATVLTALNPAVISTYDSIFPGLDTILAQQQARGARQVSYDLPEGSETNYWQVINHATWKLSDNLQIKNIISYSEFRFTYAYDYDATPYPLGGQSNTTFPTVNPNFFTEEVQLEGNALDKALTYTTGFYMDRTTQGGQGGIQGYTTVPDILVIPPLEVLEVNSGDSKAVYGQATYDVGSAIPALHGLSVTGGLRYTWEDSANWVLLVIAPPATGGSASFRYPSYTFDVDYQIGTGLHAYLAVRDAYKSGGINGQAPDDSPLHTFAPEKLADVELGLKSEFKLGDMPVRLDVDGYNGDYTNIQRTAPAIINGLEGNLNQNAAAGVVRGAEFEGTIVPVQGLTLAGTYSYIFSKYTKIANSEVESVLSGAPFPYTPTNKFTLTGTYEVPLADDLGTLVLTANYTYQSSFSTAQLNNTLIKSLPGYGLLNLNAELRNIRGSNVDLAFFASNLLNKLYATGDADFYYSAIGAATLTYGDPRLFGVRLRYKFGG
jgi:iron complex outermembrane receptor protein